MTKSELIEKRAKYLYETAVKGIEPYWKWDAAPAYFRNLYHSQAALDVAWFSQPELGLGVMVNCEYFRPGCVDLFCQHPTCNQERKVFQPLSAMGEK